MQEGRIDLPFARQADVEVFAGAAPCRQCCLAQHNRCGRNGGAARVGPGRHAPGQEQRLQTAFLEILGGFGLDGTGPARGASDRGLTEQRRKAHRPGGQELLHRNVIGGRGRADVQGALLEIPVVEKRVPATEIDQLARPGADGPVYQPSPPWTC